MSDGGYAYCGEVDFGKKPVAVEFEVGHADPNVTIEMVDLSELAPSTPLARVKPAMGKVSSRFAMLWAGTSRTATRKTEVDSGSCAYAKRKCCRRLEVQGRRCMRLDRLAARS